MSATPDYVEPVMGWRAWHAVDITAKARLSERRAQDVVADGSPARRRVSAAPHPALPVHPQASRGRAERGLHLRDPRGDDEYRDLLPDHFSTTNIVPVVGRVALWGLVHEYERGWRASHAYPTCLYVPIADLGSKRAARVLGGLSTYGVRCSRSSSATPDAVIEKGIAVLAA